MEYMMNANLRLSINVLLLVWLCFSVTVGLQSWVGDETIYAKDIEERREQFHFAILANEPPGGKGWGDVGGLSIQKRVGVVYLAEGIRLYILRIPVGKIYKLLDAVFLFISLIALFIYLRKWLPETYSLIGVLYFSAALPLTYSFQLFHPWDRPQLAIYILLLILVSERKFLFLCIGLSISVAVKFDTVLLPILYFLSYFEKQWRVRVVVETATLFLLAFGLDAFLEKLFPAPLDPSRFSLEAVQQIASTNVASWLQSPLRFQPFLVHALPATLALLYLPSRCRFISASLVFALILSVVYFSLTRYEEVRAHMIVLVLLMPAALISLKRLLDSESRNVGVAASQND